MNKNNQSGFAIVPVIVVIFAALAVGGGAAYYFTDGFGSNKADDTTTKSKSEQSANDKSKSSDSDQAAKSATGTDTLPLVKTAMAGKASIKCVSKAKVDGKYAVSTMYIKDKNNIRMNIRTDMGTINSILKDQTDSYTWSEGQSRGSKFPLGKDNRNIEGQWQENIKDAEKNSTLQEISCTQTKVDNDLFTVPASVGFSDAGQFTQ